VKNKKFQRVNPVICLGFVIALVSIMAGAFFDRDNVDIYRVLKAVVVLGIPFLLGLVILKLITGPQFKEYLLNTSFQFVLGIFIMISLGIAGFITWTSPLIPGFPFQQWVIITTVLTVTFLLIPTISRLRIKYLKRRQVSEFWQGILGWLFITVLITSAVSYFLPIPETRAGVVWIFYFILIYTGIPIATDFFRSE
jgi:hypothetical protein